MAEIIRMPRMSDTMEEGNIVSWLVNEGDAVEPGMTLAEVETDKATMELDSYFEGVLLHIAIKEGTVPIDGVIAIIGEAGEDWQAALKEAENATPAVNEEAAPNEDSSSSAAQPSGGAVEIETVATSSSSNAKIKASPLAKRMAEEAGISVDAIQGSGDHGRIIKRDVEEAIRQRDNSPTPDSRAVVPAFNMSISEGYEDVTLSQMRKVIARRLGESKFSAPHFYLTLEINMDNAIAARKQMNEIAPVKISFNDMVIKAVATSLKQHPTINSSWLGDKIRINHHVNIGVAVAVEEGLMVPVVRHADLKSLSQIKVEVGELAGKARDRKLQPEEMQGNTFTISNLGMFGIEEFTAIINPPDACILAVGGIIQKPIVKDGNIAVGNMMKVTLSCDHRVVDGASGAKFLQTFKQYMEEPVRLLV